MDYSSLGAVTGACHAPVAGRQGNALAAVPSRPPSPSKNPQSLRWMWADDYEQNLSANKLLTTPVLRFVSTLQAAKPAEASAEAAYSLGEPTILCSRRMKVS